MLSLVMVLGAEIPGDALSASMGFAPLPTPAVQDVNPSVVALTNKVHIGFDYSYRMSGLGNFLSLYGGYMVKNNLGAGAKLSLTLSSGITAYEFDASGALKKDKILVGACAGVRGYSVSVEDTDPLLSSSPIYPSFRLGAAFKANPMLMALVSAGTAGSNYSFDGGIVFSKKMITVAFGVDYNFVLNPVFGGGLSYRKSLEDGSLVRVSFGASNLAAGLGFFYQAAQGYSGGVSFLYHLTEVGSFSVVASVSLSGEEALASLMSGGE